MVNNKNKVDLNFRSKIRCITQLIQKAKTKIKKNSELFLLNNDLEKTKRQLEELIDARENMKREYEGQKTKALNMEMNDVIAKHKSYFILLKCLFVILCSKKENRYNYL